MTRTKSVEKSVEKPKDPRSLLVLLLISFFCAHGAEASLGDNVGSVSNDQIAFKSKAVRRSANNQYSVHEMDAGGVTVREYASNDGTVFAVTWRGLHQPDLSVLLGSHYSEFASRVASTPRVKGRRSSVVKTSKAIVRRGGHMRDIHGRAIAPDLVPAGVDAEELP